MFITTCPEIFFFFPDVVDGFVLSPLSVTVGGSARDSYTVSGEML